jgi:hypothetical protein
MFLRNKFEAISKDRQKNTKYIADILGVTCGTLYKKMAQRTDFTRGEVQAIKDALNLTEEEIISIFYA